MLSGEDVCECREDEVELLEYMEREEVTVAAVAADIVLGR